MDLKFVLSTMSTELQHIDCGGNMCLTVALLWDCFVSFALTVKTTIVKTSGPCYLIS